MQEQSEPLDEKHDKMNKLLTNMPSAGEKRGLPGSRQFSR